MTILSKDQILSVDDIRKEKVEVPEWGGSVFVKGMTAIQRDNYERLHMEKKLRNYRATAAAQCICDENGKSLFTEADVKTLADKSASALDRIFTKMLELSGASEDDIDHLAKN